jgi:hypothetical protein
MDNEMAKARRVILDRLEAISHDSGTTYPRDAVVAALSDEEALWIARAWVDATTPTEQEQVLVAMATRLFELGVRD